MVHCRACNITAAARNFGITFHRFPKNKNQRRAWLNFCQMDEESNENLNTYVSLCSQHFEESCFDRTSAVKIRLKELSVPTIHILRSKREKISATVNAMKIFVQTESDTSSTAAITANMSTDTATINHSFDMDDTSITMEDSTVNDTSQMNILVRETDIPLGILPSDTPKKVVLKKKIVFGRSLAKKSDVIRNLQKKNWKQKQRIFQLKSVINELTKKNLISNDNTYTIMQEFGSNEQLINRLFKKIM